MCEKKVPMSGGWPQLAALMLACTDWQNFMSTCDEQWIGRMLQSVGGHDQGPMSSDGDQRCLVLEPRGQQNRWMSGFRKRLLGATLEGGIVEESKKNKDSHSTVCVIGIMIVGYTRGTVVMVNALTVPSACSFTN